MAKAIERESDCWLRRDERSASTQDRRQHGRWRKHAVPGGRWIRDARENGIGVFDRQDPLRLLPFDVGFLSRRRPPDRWVIDLSKNDDVLIKPQNYYTVPNVEDRLFLPEEYVPLFVEAGWKRQTDGDA